MTTLTAPAAPGRLGEALDPPAVQAYLAALESWLRGRRTELDDLDAAAQRATRSDQLTADLTLSMALWKAASDRYQLLLATWDGGRVGRTERERLSALVWGRLDATLDRSALPAPRLTGSGSGLALSLPEACRLSDALAGQLKTRLELDPAADEYARRVKDLRAQLERLRDQVGLEPAQTRPGAQHTLQGLVTRTDDVAARVTRGGDVGGLLGPLENDAARFERDLIVGNAQRRDTRDQVAAAEEHRADLEAREGALERLARQAVRAVSPAPRNAVPDVSALGPVPSTPAELAAYQRRLDRVGAALSLAQERYAAALAERVELVALVDAYAAKAAAVGVAGRADVAAAEAQVREVLAREPAPVPVARRLVAAYQAWIDWSAAETDAPARTGAATPTRDEEAR